MQGFGINYSTPFDHACLTHPRAIRAQENYLYQFPNHVNPYTGVAYKDDPDIIAFEVSNEPHHQGTVEEVVSFINRMVAAMRRTGTPIPIFYNMSHSIHRYRAYLEADIQGGTFQWYPAMARSFRESGMQVATHFDYDAMFLAPYNTNYGTHYMSLPYAPQKALSLKIAGAVFHEIPRFSSFGDYPQNNTFGNFRVDYENDLVEMVSPTRFYYSNHTAPLPPAVEQLMEIAGYGNSPLVQYDGKGAYFLDHLKEGVWRLEVMPDAHWLGEPYARVSPGRQVAAVHYTRSEMTINLPGLGVDFASRGINEGNTLLQNASNGTFIIEPGVYILQARQSRAQTDPGGFFKNIRRRTQALPRIQSMVCQYPQPWPPQEKKPGNPAGNPSPP